MTLTSHDSVFSMIPIDYDSAVSVTPVSHGSVVLITQLSQDARLYTKFIPHRPSGVQDTADLQLSGVKTPVNHDSAVSMTP
jgi:hypothetical protein